MREDPELREAVVSVDTYYASVARDAVAVGADMVNDVSGGTLDPKMLSQVMNLVLMCGRRMEYAVRNKKCEYARRQINAL
jgi:dihydropteroate synthase